MENIGEGWSPASWQAVDAVQVVRGLAAGLIGGLVGTIVMTQFQNWANTLAQRVKPPASHDAGNGQHAAAEEPEATEPATTQVAVAISKTVLQHTLPTSEKPVAGLLVHYGFGTAAGGLYGVAAEVTPAATLCAGTLFGTALWLLADEVVVPTLRLGSSPLKTPVSVHAYAWASHLVYGFTTDAIRQAVRRLL